MSKPSHSPISDLQRISVAMATYNGSRFIQEQLDSLERQTLVPFELVVTDDGSTDDTLEIVRRFGERVTFPVRIFPNPERLGYADNFFRSASLCEGPIVAYCDQDDRWLENKLEVCSRYFQDPEVMLTCHTAELWDGEHSIGRFFPEIAKTEIHPPVSLDPLLLIPGFTIIFRRSLLQLLDNKARLRHILNLGSTFEPMAHDNWTFVLGSTVGKVVTIAESLTLYRQHNANAKGAPEERSAGADLMLSLTNTGYSEMAGLEAEYAEMFSRLAAKVTVNQKPYANRAAQNFAMRSRFHYLRAAIFEGRSNILKRGASFIQLLGLGAYRNSTDKTRLGSRAALKDLVFGVSGFHKWKKRSAA